MKTLLVLLLGFGTFSAVSCSSTQTADVKSTETFTLALTGMT